MIGVTVHHDGVDISQFGKAVHAASVNLASVHEGDALMGSGDHSCFGLGHLGKVGRKAAAGNKSARAHDGKIGVDHLESLHGKWAVQIAMTFAQCPAQHDDIDRGHALVNIIGDGNVGRDNGDAVALIKEPDELERRGARVDEQGVTVIDEFNGALCDGLFGGDVDIDAAILRGNSQTLVERYGATMRAAQLACFGERVQVGAGGDGGHAKGLGDFCYLHRGVVLEHFHDGGAAFVGKSTVGSLGHVCSILG